VITALDRKLQTKITITLEAIWWYFMKLNIYLGPASYPRKGIPIQRLIIGYKYRLTCNNQKLDAN
jgi:hypothetical protein